jgi:HrpA-like RNA helicase
MSAFSHIILDEVHERCKLYHENILKNVLKLLFTAVDTDLLIAIIQRFLNENSPHTKIVLMSATMDIDQLADAFSFASIDGSQQIPPIINLPDDYRPHVIEIEYLEKVVQLIPPPNKEILIDYSEPSITEGMYKLAANLVSLLVMPRQKMQNTKLTILIFLPGIHEIETFQSYVTAVLTDDLNKNAEVYVMHSLLSTEDQKKVFATSEKNKLILSTNISEVSFKTCVKFSILIFRFNII